MATSLSLLLAVYNWQRDRHDHVGDGTSSNHKGYPGNIGGHKSWHTKHSNRL